MVRGTESGKLDGHGIRTAGSVTGIAAIAAFAAAILPLEDPTHKALAGPAIIAALSWLREWLTDTRHRQAE